MKCGSADWSIVVGLVARWLRLSSHLALILFSPCTFLAWLILTKVVVISRFRSLSPTGRDLSPESPLTPPTVRLRKKAYSDLASGAIPLLSLSADEESPSKPPTASLTVETDDKYRIHRTHSLPAEREQRLSAVPKLELSCKSWDLRITILLACVAGV